MGYREPIDEKYEVIVENAIVRITRNGEDWLTDPPGAKAWIAVADRLERDREDWEESGSTLSVPDYLSVVEQISSKLTAAWGWTHDDPDARKMAELIANNVHQVAAKTRTDTMVLVRALFSK